MGDFDVMQGAFSCDKPITELTMIWNGGQDVIVQAFDGDANDDFLGEMAVTQGMPVTFNGFTSRPNNKTWVVYDANRVKLGESVFHVSCSDDDMDGPEDCGLPQGDGKENDPARINDWLLEGMLGSTSRLTCTPGDDGTAPQSSDPNATTSGGSMIAGLIEVEGMSLFGGSIWLEDVAAGDGGVNGPTVTITWKTNERATSVIIYGKKKDQLTNIITDLELDTFHSLTIPGLTPGKNYHWAIVGDDYDGNLTEPGEVTLCQGAERGTRFGGVAEASAGSDARLRGDRGAARTASGRYLPMAFRQPWRAGIDAGQGPGASVSPMGVCFLWFSAPVRGT